MKRRDLIAKIEALAGRLVRQRELVDLPVSRRHGVAVVLPLAGHVFQPDVPLAVDKHIR